MNSGGLLNGVYGLRVSLKADSDLVFNQTTASGSYINVVSRDAVYTSLKPFLYEIAPGMLVNPSAITYMRQFDGEIHLELNNEESRLKIQPASTTTFVAYGGNQFGVPQVFYDQLLGNMGALLMSVQGAFNAEANARSSSYNSLDSRIATNQQGLATETHQRLLGDAYAQTFATDEIASTIGTDSTTLQNLQTLVAQMDQNQINNLLTLIDQETANRQAADAAIDTRLIAAESTLEALDNNEIKALSLKVGVDHTS
nr:hypothetical protein [uncultured Mediterranean phage uvMED]